MLDRIVSKLEINQIASLWFKIKSWYCLCQSPALVISKTKTCFISHSLSIWCLSPDEFLSLYRIRSLPSMQLSSGNLKTLLVTFCFIGVCPSRDDTRPARDWQSLWTSVVEELRCRERNPHREGRRSCGFKRLWRTEAWVENLMNIVSW